MESTSDLNINIDATNNLDNEKDEGSNNSAENLMETVDVQITEDSMDSNMETEIIELGISAVADDNESYVNITVDGEIADANIAVTSDNEANTNTIVSDVELQPNTKIVVEIDTVVKSGEVAVDTELKNNEVDCSIKVDELDTSVNNGGSNRSDLRNVETEMDVDSEDNKIKIDVKTDILTEMKSETEVIKQSDEISEIEQDVNEVDFKGFEAPQKHPLISAYKKTLLNKKQSFAYEDFVHEEIFEFSDDNLSEFKGFDDNSVSSSLFDDEQEVFRESEITGSVIMNRMVG